MIDLPNTLPDQKYYTERIETSGPWDGILKALRMLYFLKIPPPRPFWREKLSHDYVCAQRSILKIAWFQVRWEHEDDCEQCNSCHQSFSVAKRKHHCRHCGRIFCADCLTKIVNSGPNQRPSRVCEVCHTLLVQNSAPYFSTVAPNLGN